MAPNIPADVSITPGDTADTDDLIELWIALAKNQRRHNSHLLAEENSEPIRQTMLKHLVTDTVLVARREGTIVGFVTFGQESEHFEQDTTRGLIHNIFVTEPYRDEGIGSELLHAAESTLFDRGVDTVALQAMADNEKAKAFYRDHDYTPQRIEFEKSPESDTLTSNDR